MIIKYLRSFNGKGVRAYSAKRTLQDIDFLYNELGIKQLEILDDDFTFDRDRTLEICNGLIKRNYDLIWNLENGIRLGTLNDEVIHALVAAKCGGISVGVESGNDKTLALCRKPLSVNMLYRKAELLRKYPELYVWGFNWGQPDEKSAISAAIKSNKYLTKKYKAPKCDYVVYDLNDTNNLSEEYVKKIININ